jgi:hypothetical protein
MKSRKFQISNLKKLYFRCEKDFKYEHIKKINKFLILNKFEIKQIRNLIKIKIQTDT